VTIEPVGKRQHMGIYRVRGGLEPPSAGVHATASDRHLTAFDLGKRQSPAGHLHIRYTPECTRSSITGSITAGVAALPPAPTTRPGSGLLVFKTRCAVRARWVLFMGG